jgi:hypothetical protein
VHLVNSLAGQIGKSGKVVGAAQPLRLEATHLAGRGCGSSDGPVADHPKHGGIAVQPTGVIHVFLAGRSPEHRLTQQTGQPMWTVLAGACIGESVGN